MSLSTLSVFNITNQRLVPLEETFVSGSLCNGIFTDQNLSFSKDKGKITHLADFPLQAKALGQDVTESLAREIKKLSFSSKELALQVLYGLIAQNCLEKKVDGVPPKSYFLVAEGVAVCVHFSGFEYWYVYEQPELESMGAHNILIFPKN